MDISFIRKFGTARLWLAALLLPAAILSACTLDGIDRNANAEFTEADLATASQILGESLSDESAGVMSSLHDAVAIVSENGFVHTSLQKTDISTLQNDDKTGRGRESNIRYSYDPATGIHLLSFERNINSGSYAKTVHDTLEYVYSDVNNNFIERPDRQSALIQTINFKGSRRGTITTPQKNSFFVRRDTFLIDGVSGETALLRIDGKHHGKGSIRILEENGTVREQDYQLQVSFLNIVIEKDVVNSARSMERGVNGTLSWELTMERSENGSTGQKTIRGTVEMNGDGTALLRFREFRKLFQVNLDDGDVKDPDNEFEGLVKSADEQTRSFVLVNGRVITITQSTDIDASGDITSLKGVTQALEAGTYVWAEGEGYTEGEVFIATEVELETDEEAADYEQDIEGTVAGVDLDRSTVTFQDSTVVLLNQETDIHESGDLTSLEEVKQAYGRGERVTAEGKAIPADEEDIDFIATEIRFDYDDN